MPWVYAPCKAVFPVILPPSVAGLTKAIKRNVLQPPLSRAATRTPKAEEASAETPSGENGVVQGSPRLPAEVPPASLEPDESSCEGCRLWAKVPSVTDALCGSRTNNASEDEEHVPDEEAAPEGTTPAVLPAPVLPSAPEEPSAPSPATVAAAPPPAGQAGDQPVEAGESGEEAAEGREVLILASVASDIDEPLEEVPRAAEDATGDVPERERGSASSSSSSSSSSESPVAVAPAPKAVTCDKCDGKHPTDACPHFKKPREDHKDAWVNYNRKKPLQMGKSGGNVVLRNCRCVPQPGDGSCLFHSLCFGLNGGKTGQLRAGDLRWELANFIESNPQLEIAGDTIEEWVRWDANTSVNAYARRMAVGGWGGGIEMAVCSLLKKVNVHVYERRWLGGFRRISCFDCPEPTERSIHVLYQGGMHYDALVTCS